MTTEVASVSECSVESCAFNHDGCTAYAITVGGSRDHASCSTFIDTSATGGLPMVLAHVGACQRTECAYNDHLMCAKTNVTIGHGADTADCLSYQPQ